MLQILLKYWLRVIVEILEVVFPMHVVFKLLYTCWRSYHEFCHGIEGIKPVVSLPTQQAGSSLLEHSCNSPVHMVAAM